MKNLDKLELTILVGTWQMTPLFALVAAVGVLVAAAFTLRAIQVSFFGKTELVAAEAPAHSNDESHHFSAITWPEKIGAILLISATVLIGLKPDLLLNWIVPALQSPAFHAVLKGGSL